jgi:hypothetical protein
LSPDVSDLSKRIVLTPPETFDIRIEVQAPANGSEAYNNGKPDPTFSVKIGGEGAELVDVTTFFGIADPVGEQSSTTRCCHG